MKKTYIFLNIFNHKLYKYSNKSYIYFIEKIIKNYELNKYDIKINYIDNFFHNRVSNEVFYICENGKIKFLHKYNLIKFEYTNRCKINSLININIKNQKSYELIKTLECLQNKFLVSNDLKNLIYISQEDIIKKHREVFNSYLSKPLISLIINNTKYKDRNNKTCDLFFLTPKKHFIQHTQIKFILALYPYADDKTLQTQLNIRFSTKISTVQISKIRKRYFISNKYKRKENTYQRFKFYFGDKKLLNIQNTNIYRNIKGVYEFMINEKIEYTYKKSCTVYIGSSKNLNKRLNEYIRKGGHTKKVRNFFDKHIMYFRIIKTNQYKELEVILLNSFKKFYGEIPILNTKNN